MGCVTVKLSEEGQKHKQITMFSWCSKCRELSKSVTMQNDTYCLSFGKYLELRFHGHAYRCRDLNRDETDLQTSSENKESICTHSIHRDHVQYFSYNGIVVSFSYTPVEAWEISLPLPKLLLKIHKTNEPAKYIDEIKSFSARGHEMFATIYDRLAQLSTDVLNSLKQTLNSDQLFFREKVAAVQILLSEASANVFEIDDAVFIMKKTLAESIEAWTQRLTDASTQYRAICSPAARSDLPSSVQATDVSPPIQPTDDSTECPHIDSGTVCTEDYRSDPESPLDSIKSNVFLSRDVSVDSENSTTQKSSATDGNSSLSTIQPTNQITERDTKSSISSDKKSVKTILRELLPSDKTIQPLQSPIPTSEHLTLPIGCVPVLIHDQDISSVIAYTLASFDYKSRLENSNLSDIHRKSYDASTDTEDASTLPSNSKESDKEKKTKLTQNHIEMNFQDSSSSTQFICKVYFARDFDSMRNKILGLFDSLDGFEKTSFYRRNTSVDDSKSNKEFDRKISNNSLNISCDPLKSNEKSEDVSKKDNEKIRAAFIRSLSKSVRWEARGGKSGSKFCKTMGI